MSSSEGKSTSSQSGSLYAPSPSKKKSRDISVAEKEKVVNYWLLPGTPKHHKKKFNYKSWKFMKHKYTWLTGEWQLYEMKKFVDRVKTTRDKLKEEKYIYFNNSYSNDL